MQNGSPASQRSDPSVSTFINPADKPAKRYKKQRATPAHPSQCHPQNNLQNKGNNSDRR
jgi:hypothetical protein